MLAGLVIASVTCLALVVLGHRAKRHAESISCGNCMCSIGFAAKTWALDNGGHLPCDFCSMLNYMATTRILVCPGDHGRIPATNWSSLNQTNCSYEIVAPGLSVDDTTNVYFRCKYHGYFGYADGTVFDGKQRRRKDSW